MGSVYPSNSPSPPPFSPWHRTPGRSSRHSSFPSPRPLSLCSGLSSRPVFTHPPLQDSSSRSSAFTSPEPAVRPVFVSLHLVAPVDAGSLLSWASVLPREPAYGPRPCPTLSASVSSHLLFASLPLTDQQTALFRGPHLSPALTGPWLRNHRLGMTLAPISPQGLSVESRLCARHLACSSLCASSQPCLFPPAPQSQSLLLENVCRPRTSARGPEKHLDTGLCASLPLSSVHTQSFSKLCLIALQDADPVTLPLPPAAAPPLLQNSLPLIFVLDSGSLHFILHGPLTAIRHRSAALKPACDFHCS